MMPDRKNSVIMVIGGAKSGKSRHALKLASETTAARKVFLATCIPFDKELRQRVKAHQLERGPDWLTVEAPTQLTEALAANRTADSVILIDCITLWLNNLLYDNNDINPVDRVSAKLAALIGALEQRIGIVIVVSNEVGGGIVPRHPSARKFRDMAGIANQQLAACADHVDWVVAGIPVRIK